MARYETGAVSYLEEEWFRAARGGLSNHTLPLALKIEGDFDVAACRDVVGDLVRRHEALRTGFRERAGRLERIVLAEHAPDLAVIDVASSSDPDLEAERLMVVEACQLIDLTEPPLWRGFVVRLAPRSHVAFFWFHHAIFDGMSSGVFARDFARLYVARARGRTPRLPDLPVRLADHAARDRERTLSSADLAYWERQLPAQSHRLPLAPVEGHAVLGMRPFPAIAAEHGQAIVQRGIGLGVTATGAFAAVVLAGIAGYFDGCAVVGFSDGGRSEDTRSMIGSFADHTVARVDLESAPHYAALARRVHDAHGLARRHVTPVGLLRRALGAEYQGPDNRIFDVSVNYMPQRPQPRRDVGAEGRTEVFILPSPIQMWRPVVRLGFSGIASIGYSLRQGPDGAMTGEVWGCAYRLGGGSGRPLAVLDEIGHEFARTAAEVAASPDEPPGE